MAGILAGRENPFPERALKLESWIQYSSHRVSSEPFFVEGRCLGRWEEKVPERIGPAATLELKILDSIDWKE